MLNLVTFRYFFFFLLNCILRQQSLCEMKYKYVGRPGIGESAFLEPEDVVIEQQHCGGETIKVLIKITER